MFAKDQQSVTVRENGHFSFYNTEQCRGYIEQFIIVKAQSGLGL